MTIFMTFCIGLCLGVAYAQWWRDRSDALYALFGAVALVLLLIVLASAS